MEQMKSRLTKGLTAYQIKMLAVILMTIDHLGAYGHEIPVFSLSAYNYQLRLIGRSAMPLFLFALTESIRYTRNRPRFLLRLYLAAVGMGVFTVVTNCFFGSTIGHFTLSNIFYTYLYVAIYVILIENFLRAAKDRDWKKGILSSVGIAATAIPHILYRALESLPLLDYGLTIEESILVKDLIEVFAKGPWLVEYSLLFVLMGVLMYFAKNKYGKAVVLVVFSLLCYFGEQAMRSGLPLWEWMNVSPLNMVLSALQSKMILAAPIMLLYNGQKGRGDKWFFYLYYPLHRYGISIIEYLYLLFFDV